MVEKLPRKFEENSGITCKNNGQIKVKIIDFLLKLNYFSIYEVYEPTTTICNFLKIAVAEGSVLYIFSK